MCCVHVRMCACVHVCCLHVCCGHVCCVVRVCYMQHVHATCTCMQRSKLTQTHTPRICNTHLQHAHTAHAQSHTCVQYAHATCTCNEPNAHIHATHTCNTHVQHMRAGRVAHPVSQLAKFKIGQKRKEKPISNFRNW